MKYWSLIFLLFSIDFATKMMAKSFLLLKTITIWDPYLKLYLAFNEGIAFSFPLPNFLQIFITSIFIIGFLWWWHENFYMLLLGERVGSLFVFSGALGNFWERVVFGEVTDFILIRFPFYSFPIFNIADILIFFGVLIWLWSIHKKIK